MSRQGSFETMGVILERACGWRVLPDKSTMVEDPKEDVSGESMAIGQSLTHAVKATGPERPRLVEFYNADVLDMASHAQFLAKRIVPHGGEPNTEAPHVPQAEPNRDMLEAAPEVGKRRSRTTVSVRSRPNLSETYVCRPRWKTGFEATSIRTKERCRS